MGLNKTDEAANGCWGKALEDEPVFVFLARDPDAPAFVDKWADKRQDEIEAGTRPMADAAQVAEARRWAAAATQWRAAANFKWRK